MLLAKPVYRVTTDIYNWLLPLLVINILWTLLSLTFVLLPPATVALYEIAYLASTGEGPRVARYVIAVRRWVLKSWLWGAVLTFVLVASFIAVNLYASLESALGLMLTVITMVIIVFGWMIQFYFWPYVVLQTKVDFRQAAHNATFTILGDPLWAFFNAGLALVVLIVGIIFIAPLIFIVPVFMAFLGVYSLRAWLLHHDLLDAS